MAFWSKSAVKKENVVAFHRLSIAAGGFFLDPDWFISALCELD